MRKKTRLVLALDLTDRKRAMEVAEQVGPHVDAVKVNYPIVLNCGLGIVREIAAFSPVICDFKVADVPNTNRLIVGQVVASGASGVICQGFVGRDSLEACVNAGRRIDIFVVAEMSHPGSGVFIKPHAEEIARLAMNVGATGIIAPGTRPDRITALRKIIGKGLILAPGIGAQGGKASAAIRAGADYVIVGRTIYEAIDPKSAAESIVQDIKNAGD
jgi:orotidine-5'-phosphate decarboxylase